MVDPILDAAEIFMASDPKAPRIDTMDWSEMRDDRRRSVETVVTYLVGFEEDVREGRDVEVAFGYCSLLMVLTHAEPGGGSFEMFCRSASDCLATFSKNTSKDVRTEMLDVLRRMAG